jgi:hypothetical protein
LFLDADGKGGGLQQGAFGACSRSREATDDERVDPALPMAMFRALEEQAKRYLDRAVAQSATLSKCGVGIEVTREHERKYVIHRVSAHGPADRSGIWPGDTLEEVDGIRLWGLDSEALKDFLLGPAGSTVSLGVVRDGLEMVFRVVREHPEADGSYAYKSSVPDISKQGRNWAGSNGKAEQQVALVAPLSPDAQQGKHYLKVPTSLSLASQARLSELSKRIAGDAEPSRAPKGMDRGGLSPLGLHAREEKAEVVGEGFASEGTQPGYSAKALVPTSGSYIPSPPSQAECKLVGKEGDHGRQKGIAVSAMRALNLRIGCLKGPSS